MKRKTYTGRKAGSAAKKQMSQRAIVARELGIPVADVGYTRRMRGPRAEVKGVDTALALSPVLATTNTNGSMFTLNLVPPGTAAYNRIGRKIRLKSVRIRGAASFSFIYGAANAMTLGNVLRMVVVHDKQPQGVLPNFDTIFGRTLQDGTQATGFLDSLKFANTDRFRVLKDCVYARETNYQPAVGGISNLVNVQVPIDEFIKLKGMETQFGGVASPATIADISSGAVYVFFRAEYDSATFGGIQIDGDTTARLRYYDV